MGARRNLSLSVDLLQMSDIEHMKINFCLQAPKTFFYSSVLLKTPIPLHLSIIVINKLYGSRNKILIKS